MKIKFLVISLTLVLTLLFGTMTYASENPVGAGAAAEQEEFTLEEMLQYALEDERMAQAEYEAIMEAFDVTRPFSNIEKAEVKHEEAVIGLYETRGLEVPEFDATDYVVIPDSLEAIFEIGVQAEINNIAMYEKFLQQDLDDDVRLVFEALRDGSINHLAAFEKGLERRGEPINGDSNRNGFMKKSGVGVNSSKGNSNRTSTNRKGLSNNEKNYSINLRTNLGIGDVGYCVLD